MTIYKHIPYVYFIKWTVTDQKYVGVRYAKDCHPDDLFESYFTSSKYVKKHIAIHGKPDIIHVCKTFTDVVEAQEYEINLLTLLGVEQRDDYLNRVANFKGVDNIGRKHTTEQNRKKSLRQMGKKQTQHQKDTVRKKLPQAWIIRSPFGASFEVIDLREFCRVNKIDQGNMVKVADHAAKYSDSKMRHKGWGCKRAVRRA